MKETILLTIVYLGDLCFGSSSQKAVGFDLSGAIMSQANFKAVNFKDATLSKAYAVV